MLLTKQVDTRIGLPVTTYFFNGKDMSYFYHIKLVKDTVIELHFEGSYITKGFESKQARDSFIAQFKKEHKEAMTYGKH